MTSSNAPSAEGQRAAQVGHLQVRVVTEPPPGLLQHPGAVVEAGHDGAPVAQRREQRAGTAAGVENPPAGHVPGQGQDRGSFVVGVARWLASLSAVYASAKLS